MKTNKTKQEPTPSIHRGRPLVPRGGNDVVFTPDNLAAAIVAHYRPTGRILEPCKGDGAFVRAMPGCQWCEISEGKDFYAFDAKVDWIVTNPPWSQFRKFLNHAMALSDNIVFLALVNAWFMRARLRDITQNGFHIREIAFVDTPKIGGWPQTGFQLGAVHCRRGSCDRIKLSNITY